MKYKYIIMVIDDHTHTARRAIVTMDIATAQKETRIRILQGKRAYFIREEVEQ